MLCVPDSKAIKTHRNLEGTAVHVKDPTVNFLPDIDSTYRTPRRSLSPPCQFSNMQLLSDKKAGIFAEKVAGENILKKLFLLQVFLYGVPSSRNDSKTLYDHISSRELCTRLRNKNYPLRHISCSRTFDFNSYFLICINRAAHQKNCYEKNPINVLFLV